MTVGTRIPERGDERVQLLAWMADEFKYADVAVRRWENFTGRKAEKISP